MKIPDYTIEGYGGRLTIVVGGDDDKCSEDFRIRVVSGWTAQQFDLNAAMLIDLRHAIDEALRAADKCEHGITDGDYCLECDKECKAARIGNEP